MIAISLDKLVQFNVMGWDEYNPNFSPTTSIEDAMKVEQRLYELGFEALFRRCTGSNHDRSGATNGQFFCNVIIENGEYEPVTSFKTIANTLQLALCQSSIKAVGCLVARQ